MSTDTIPFPAATEEAVNDTAVSRHDWQDRPTDSLELDDEAVEALDTSGFDTLGKVYEFLVSSSDDSLNGVDLTALRAAFDEMFQAHPDWKPETDFVPVAAKEDLSAETPAEVVDQTVLARLRRKAEHLEVIQEKWAEVDKLFRGWKDKKAAADAAKKLYEAENEVLHDMISEENAPQPTLPGCSTVEMEEQQQENEPNQAAQPDSEAWRDVTIEELGFPPAICKILREDQDEPIVTLGDINNWCKQFSLDDLSGIGPAKVTIMEDCMEQFWATWEQPVEGEALEPEGPEAVEGETPAVDLDKTIIQLTSDIDGYDDETHQLFAGAEFAVVSWSEDNPPLPTIASENGAPVTLAESQFEITQ